MKNLLTKLGELRTQKKMRRIFAFCTIVFIIIPSLLFGVVFYHFESSENPDLNSIKELIEST